MKFNNKNIYISPNTKIGKNVKIGDNSIIYDNVEIGDNSIICNSCVIGEPQNDYYFNENYKNPTTIIGQNALIRSHSIIYAGSVFGRNFSCGHRVTIRENVIADEHLSVGTLSDIQGFVRFGKYCRLHSNIFIGQQSEIGNFVFIYPFVVFTNDPHPPSNICKGPKIGDYTQIAAHSVIFPMIEIGKNCLIGASSTVNKSFEDELVIVGTPAKVLCSIRNIRSKEKEGTMHYPWMYNFKRNMPWSEIGYEQWLKQQGL